MRRIKTGVTNSLQNKWPKREIISNYNDDSKKTWYRYIQISVKEHNEKIAGLHYEFDEYEVMFHFEGDFANANYLALRRFVQKETSNIEGLTWQDQCGYAKCCCKYKDQNISDDDTLMAELERLMNLMDPIIERAMKEAPSLDLLLTQHHSIDCSEESVLVSDSQNCCEGVRFVEGSFADLMKVALKIPSYQRNYCWEDANIEALWNSLVNSNGDIHLGNIILQEKNGKFNIIDGQQRLTTLSLFAMALGYPYHLHLLKEKVKSSQSAANIANAKSVIKKLCQRRELKIRQIFADEHGKSIRFGLLVLGEKTGLDLAYTFFNSQNSKGVPLSDYDLLKAHHLQYILQDLQARHLAANWDKLVSAPASHGSEDNEPGSDLKNTLGKHLFRLRKWMRFEDLSTEGRVIRDEFVAAPVITAIPPFGEKFNFYEKIQGGTHFFEYADKFVEQYKIFKNTDVAKVLENILAYSSHCYYKDVIETMLFGYFLKFKNKYLPEAFFIISSIISDDRYSSGYMRQKRLMEYARKSRIIMMIDQATSPTFFLAEGLNAIKINPLTISDDDMKGKRQEYYRELRNGIKLLMQHFSEDSIRNKIVELYEI